MLYREIMAVCSEIHTKHTNTPCGQNVEFVNATPGGTNSDHWVYMVTYHRLIEPWIFRILTDPFICSEEPRKSKKSINSHCRSDYSPGLTNRLEHFSHTLSHTYQTARIK